MNHFDYNLLKVLEVLLEELSVTAAASRLHLSQSAVSKQLAKLRETFDDPLFERTAHGLRPTPRARQLAPDLHQILQRLEQFTRPEAFEPIQSSREFRIHLVETAYSLTYPFFMPSMLSQAPHVSLNSQTWNHESKEKLLKCEIDMAICSREWDERSPLHVKNIPQELNYVELVRDYPVCMFRKDHPLLQEEWNRATFLKYRHLQVTFGGIDRWLLDEVLALDGLCRDIAVNMTDFYSAMSLCEQCDLILCAPARYAAKMAKHFELITRDVPVDVVPGNYVLLWHSHFEHDPGHCWLRELIIGNVNGEVRS
ncbi:LysR family transcriptional regulator [uncultured Photobacterium sp.]|uniref:LysR family transcriptional regulator n=1 Tax=uncultured Photobacterium sp. TaxID=173973 RepID=UPI00263329AF|nr:LysR family transcriptional regulator [uncultured Photobacterium sp.]